jgi:tetratricopeptide (TPR) repeat protein
MLALPRPLVVVLDDLHWADSALLDLIEEIAAASRGAPLMIVCTARGALLDRRSRWAGGAVNTITLHLAPLAAGEVRRLVVHLLGGMDIALLGARLDNLGGPERGVVERAAVIGRQFTAEAIRELSPPEERDTLAVRLRTLVGKDLIVPDEGALLGTGHDQGSAFTHALIQEVAYHAIAKETRAELHERCANWLERMSAGGVQVDEAVGDVRTKTHGRVGALAVKHFSGRESISRDEEPLEQAVQVFERDGDKLGLATTWRLWADIRWAAGRLARAEGSAQHAVELARQSGDEPLLARSVSTYCFILFWGPRHVDDVGREVAAKLDWARRRGVRSLEIDALRILARIRAMQGRFEEARQLLQETSEVISHYGDTLVLVGGFVSAGLVELLAGQPAAAERILRRGYRTLEEMGGKGQLLHLTTLLARALAQQGRDREAVELTREWDQIDSSAEALADHADVLRRVGRAEEAVTHAQQALELYQAKGNLVGVGRMRQFVGAGAA